MDDILVLISELITMLFEHNSINEEERNYLLEEINKMISK